MPTNQYNVKESSFPGRPRSKRRREAERMNDVSAVVGVYGSESLWAIQSAAPTDDSPTPSSVVTTSYPVLAKALTVSDDINDVEQTPENGSFLKGSLYSRRNIIAGYQCGEDLTLESQYPIMSYDILGIGKVRKGGALILTEGEIDIDPTRLPNGGVDETEVIRIVEDWYTDQKYVLPVASSIRLGGVKVGSDFAIQPDGTITMDAQRVQNLVSGAFVNKSGDTMTGPLIIEHAFPNLKFYVKGVCKGEIGYSNGIYFWNSARQSNLHYTDKGLLLFEGGAVWHAGNANKTTIDWSAQNLYLAYGRKCLSYEAYMSIRNANGEGSILGISGLLVAADHASYLSQVPSQGIIAEGSIYSQGSVVAGYRNAEALDPVSQYPIMSDTMMGIHKIKKGGGLITTSDGLSIDPDMIGGGLDETALKNYLDEKTYYHAGNANKTTIDWSARHLVMNGNSLMRGQTAYIEFLQDGTFDAKKICTGGLLASNTYIDYGKVPSGGIYSKGDIKTAALLYASGSVINAVSANAVLELQRNNVAIGSLFASTDNQVRIENSISQCVLSLHPSKILYYGPIGASYQVLTFKELNPDLAFQDRRGEIAAADLNTFTIKKSGTYKVNHSGDSEILAVFAYGYGVSASSLEFLGNYSNSDLRVRTSRDNVQYSIWRQIAFTDSTVSNANALDGRASGLYIYGNQPTGVLNVTGVGGRDGIRRSCLFQDNIAAGYSLGIHVSHTASDAGFQLSTGYGSSSELYFRTMYGYTWGPDYRIWSTGNSGTLSFDWSAKNLAIADTIYVTDGGTTIKRGPGTSIRIKTIYGYVDIGPESAYYCDFYTDRSRFYFNKPLYVCGDILAGPNWDKQVWHAGNANLPTANWTTASLWVKGVVYFSTQGVNLSAETNVATIITTAYGNVAIGPRNSSFCHYNTSMSGHYFNQPLYVAGEIYTGTSYNQKVYHTGNANLTTVNWSANYLYLNGDARLQSQSAYFGVYTSGGNAKLTAVGGLLVSDLYNQYGKVPPGGIYSKGSVYSAQQIVAGYRALELGAEALYPIATSAMYGAVKYDNSTILKNASGQLYLSDTLYKPSGLKIGGSGSLYVKFSGSNSINGIASTGAIGNLYLNYVSTTANVLVNSAGRLTATGGATSDERLKDILCEYKPDVLKDIDKIPLWEFRYKGDPNGAIHTNPVAQQLQPYFRQFVYDRGDGYLAISEGAAALNLTIRGLTQVKGWMGEKDRKITELEQRIRTLENEIQSFKTVA